MESSSDWYEGKNDYFPFVKYYLEVILSAYKEFSSRVELMQNHTLWLGAEFGTPNRKGT